jgi:hypothetical protein
VQRYELMMFPWGLGKVAMHGGHFETLAEALEGAGNHPDYEYEVWDHDHGGALVAWSGEDS